MLTARSSHLYHLPCKAKIMLSIHSSRIRVPRRRAVTMVELLAAMVVMSLIMVPLFGIMKASLRISEMSSQRQTGGFARQAALEAISRRLQGCTQVLEIADNRLVVLQADGQKAQLSFQKDNLVFENNLGSQVLSSGIAKLRFYEIGKPSTVAAGRLIAVEVVTQDTKPPYVTHNSATRVWIRPAI